MKLSSILEVIAFITVAIIIGFICWPKEPKENILSSLFYKEDPTFQPLEHETLLVKGVIINGHHYIYMKDDKNHIEVFTKTK